MEKYGNLIREDIKIFRRYFEEAVKMLGIQCIYRAPRPDKHYTTYAEIETNYYTPEIVGCIIHEHLDQKTLKKIGWASELQEQSILISVPYDLHDLQVGALFILPSGLDDGKGRMFRVVSMMNSIVYPASITCEIVPEYENTMSKNTEINKSNGVPLLNREDDDDE